MTKWKGKKLGEEVNVEPQSGLGLGQKISMAWMGRGRKRIILNKMQNNKNVVGAQCEYHAKRGWCQQNKFNKSTNGMETK